MSVVEGRRQALLAEMIDQPELEQAIRSDPAKVAREREVPLAFVEQLASLSEARLAAFRRSRQRKNERRTHQPLHIEREYGDGSVE